VKKEKPWYIIRQNDPKLFWWEVLILILAIFVTYVLPVEVAFTPDFGSAVWWQTTDTIINVLFAFDILIHFFTSIYDDDGNEVFNLREIALNYILHMTFYVDLISTSSFGSGTISKLCKCLKVARITIINKIIKQLDVKDETKAIIKGI